MTLAYDDINISLIHFDFVFAHVDVSQKKLTATRQKLKGACGDDEERVRMVMEWSSPK